MKIAFNPSTVAALTSPPKNKDITFDLSGRNIFARGVEFKGTDTNTWRDIKINNVNIGSNILDLRNGSNTTLTNTNGVVTINSTWRPVVDSLTSDSTTSSLSANQGRVLAGLINSKSDSGHNHDGRYVRYYAVTALDCNNLAVGLTVARISATNAAHINHSAYLYISDVGTPFQLQIPDSSVPYIYKRYYGSGKWSGWFKLNAGYADSAGSVDWGNVTNKPATATRWPSWGEVTGKPDTFTPSSHNHDGRYVYNYGGTQMDGASRNKNALGMSTTSGISGDWWHILQAAWNDEYRWNSQIAFPTQNRNGMYYRSGLDDNTKWGAWVKLLDSNNYNTFHHLLTNGNTTVSTSTWTNPFSAYNKNAIADGQAICVWGQNSRKYSDNEKFSTDTGDMSLWLKRVNANVASLNMVLDGEYYANGNQRLAHVSEIPNKNSWNYDDRYLKLTGGTLKGQIILPDIDVNTSYTGSIIIGASNTNNLGIDGNEIMARNNGKASTLYLNNEGGAVQLGAILRTNSNIAYIGSQSTRDMIKFINNTNDPYGNGIAIGGGGLTIIGGGEACDAIAAHYNVSSETMHVGSDSSLYLYSNLDGGWNNRETITFDTNGFTYFPSYINIGGNENNNSSPDRVWGSNGSDSYLRSYRTSALRVAYAVNADTVDGVHANQLCRIYTFNVHDEIIKVGTLTSGQSGHVCKLRFNSGIGYNALNQDKAMTVVIRASNGSPNGNGFYFEAHSESYRGGAFTTFYLHQTSKTQCELYMAAFNYSGQSTYEVSFSAGDSWTNEISHQNALPTSSIFTLPNYQIAYSDYNIASATKLATARKIWGQSFDGTADVDNTLRIRKTTGNYCEGIRIQTGDGAWSTIILGATADSGTNTNAWSIHRKSDNNFAISRNSSDGANGLVMTPTGMGLGTTSPTQRLDVAGNIRTTGDIYITHATNNNMNYNTSNPRIVFSESGTQAVGLVYTDYDSYRPSKGLKVMDTDNVDTGNVWFEVQGYNYSSGYVKNGSNDNYILLGGGGHKALSDFAYGNNYVKAFGTSNANIDSDWGQSFKTFGPIPSGTPPEQNPNISLLSIGENFDRRKQLAFIWNNDNIYYRRRVGGEGFSNWRRLAFANEIPTSLPANGGNADTVDGEHASSFVRAGNFESANLNSLDTYSFIKSVNSNVASASPGGYTGWYNVIQAVHRNGADDGPGYIGQIALGMTTNLSAMFYRTKYNGSWYAWNEVLTTNTGLLRYSRNNVNISSPNCSPIPPSLLEWTVGYPRLYDPEFIDGNNDVNVYNNAGNGVVTVTRVHDTNVGNSSSYVMKVVSASGASPNYGGWNVWTQTELGKVYTCLFRASIPSGVEIEFNTNSIGSGGGSAWLTNNMGTGKWTWYAMQVYCGSGGSTTFFFSAKSPCTWYLSYVNVIENNRASYAGLRSVYSDYLKQNASLVFGRSELQYFNQYTGVTSGAKNNANPTTDWYHILRMNHANNSGYFVDLAIPFNNNRIQFRRIVSGADAGWRRVITEEPNHNVLLCDDSSGGNVYIGATNTTSSYKLNVNGSAWVGGTLAIYRLNFLMVGAISVANKTIINIGSDGVDFQEGVFFSDTASFLKSINIRTGLTEYNAKEYSTSNHSVIIDECLSNTTFIFEPASDGQLLFMKLGKRYSNIKIRCTARDCIVVKGNNFNTLIGKNTTQDIYGDGVSRFFIYEAIPHRWIEFRCG